MVLIYAVRDKNVSLACGINCSTMSGYILKAPFFVYKRVEYGLQKKYFIFYNDLVRGHQLF